MVKEKEIIVGEAVYRLRYPIKGSKTYACALCKTPTWVSKALQAKVENGAEVQCLICALRNMPDGAVPIIPEETIRELGIGLNRRITRQELEEYIKQMRRAD